MGENGKIEHTGESMYISAIRKRFLWSLGLDKKQVEKDRYIDLSKKDIDGLPLCWLDFYESDKEIEFTNESGMFNWLRNYIGLPPEYFDTKKERSAIENYCMVVTADELKELSKQIENKKIRLYYETEEDYNDDFMSVTRIRRIGTLDDIADNKYSDYYYYLVIWR